ncbi:MAG: glycosyltransferase family 4 protein [Candidatus Fermentibacter sp.]|nr:glycosyltransferase family 4 protein [Candidatus Fermentibacter sp.]
MRILHVSPQNYTGVLTLYLKGHRALGHESRLVTFYRAKNAYEEDICLDLPFVGPMEWLWKVKRLVGAGSMRVPFTGTSERIIWSPGFVERLLLGFRNAVWTPRIARATALYSLDDFDIYHYEGGMSFFRDGRDVIRLKKAGKRIVSSYHGLDLRMRGAIKPVWDATDLHLTCEFDLFCRYPELEYIFLPFDPSAMPAAKPRGDRIRICHAPRIRAVKGTETVISAVESLQGRLPVELVLIEGLSHAEALAVKSTCHAAIDQIADGDMGYGVNSLESLSMGIPTITNLSERYREFIPDHPFILATPDNLARVLREVVLDDDLRRKHGEAGPGWIQERHHWLKVARSLHDTYRRLGWENGESGR